MHLRGKCKPALLLSLSFSLPLSPPPPPPSLSPSPSPSHVSLLLKRAQRDRRNVKMAARLGRIIIEPRIIPSSESRSGPDTNELNVASYSLSSGLLTSSDMLISFIFYLISRDCRVDALLCLFNMMS